MPWKGESRRHSLSRKGIKTASGQPKHPRNISNYISQTEVLVNEETNQYGYWEEKLIGLMDDDKILNSYELSFHIKELEDSGDITSRVADKLYNHLYFKANEKQKEFDKILHEKRLKANIISKVSEQSVSKSKSIELNKKAGKYDPDSLFYEPDDKE